MQGAQPIPQEKSRPPNSKNPIFSKHIWGGVLLGLVLVVLWYSYILFKKTKAIEEKPIPVVTAFSSVGDVPIYLAALGTVTPVYTVTIQTQLNGLLMKVLFKEGELVKQGQLLAQIDKRPYEALLVQYRGNLKRDCALLENANIDLKRYQRLWSQNSISQQTLVTQQALVHQYEGNVETDRGLIQSTEVNLIYCDIRSPIDGRIGLRQVDAGNFVQTANPTGIAVITTHNPITVIFPIAEDFVPQIMPKAFANEPLEVKAYDRQQSKLLASGKLLAPSNQIDTTTGTVKLRAIFDNKDHHLFPNQFVNIKILVNVLKRMILVPSAAVQHGNDQDFVYVLNADNTVTAKKVKTGPISGEHTVIREGLKSDQPVVVEGADKLIDGSKVIVQTSAVNSRYMLSSAL